MCIDDVRDRQPLVLAALDERFGRVRRVDQHALPGVPVAEQVAEVPVAAGADLFEDELHVRGFFPPVSRTTPIITADFDRDR